jgi:hypothetical protein
MANFSYCRFCHLLRRDVVEHRRTYLTFFAVLFISNTLIHVLGNAIEVIPDRYLVQLICMSVVYVLGACYALSLVYADIDTKERRIANFMLPASNVEKATVRHLLGIFGFQLIFIASYLCSELINALYILAANGVGALVQNSLLMHAEEGVKLIVSYAKFEEILPEAPYLMGACHLLACSLFLLGSAVFRKKAFVKTMCIMLFINPSLLIQVASCLDETLVSGPVFLLLYSLFIVALAAGVTWLAYRRYCKIQVV